MHEPRLGFGGMLRKEIVLVRVELKRASFFLAALLACASTALVGCGRFGSDSESISESTAKSTEESTAASEGTRRDAFPESPPTYSWRSKRVSRGIHPPSFVEADPDNAAFRRVMVIGASFSAGFGHDLPLSKALEEAIQLPGEYESLASSLFFRSPYRGALSQLDRVHEGEATMVIALDYLFWFAYGKRSFERRVELLLKGLQLLDTYGGPIWVGNLPDMRGASTTMLPRHWIPTREQLGLMNGIVREWARARPRVRLLPLSRWNERLHRGNPFEIRGESLVFDPDQVFTWDRLHPSPAGTRLIVQLLCAEFCEAMSAFDGSRYASLPESVPHRPATPEDATPEAMMDSWSELLPSNGMPAHESPRAGPSSDGLSPVGGATPERAPPNSGHRR